MSPDSLAATSHRVPFLHQNDPAVCRNGTDVGTKMGVTASLAFSNQGAGRVGAITEPLVTAVQGLLLQGKQKAAAA